MTLQTLPVFKFDIDFSLLTHSSPKYLTRWEMLVNDNDFEASVHQYLSVRGTIPARILNHRSKS
jgi:hypothetical protein